tara:strand:+ start:940 stop:1365 length:426 start_codon:yes stop_codon:yes gene_type:complete
MININNQTGKRQSIASDMLPDLTPLIDVMFLLIVFLILTANAVPLAIDVNLPTDEHSTTKAITDPNVITITLSKNPENFILNKTHYDSKLLFHEALLTMVNQHKDARIIIAADKNTSVDRLLNTLTFLRKHDIHVADIVMK